MTFRKPSLCFCTLAFIGLIGCGGSGTPEQGPSPTGSTPEGKLYELQISRYTSSALTNADADAILSSATAIIQTKDDTSDVPCKAILARNGDVTTFATGTGIVDSEDDYKALLALSGQVKVVNQINWCGEFKPNIVGCAPTPGTSFVVVRFEPTQEGILWDHEFGHNKGLVHREDPDAIMNPVIQPSHLGLDTSESNTLAQ